MRDNTIIKNMLIREYGICFLGGTLSKKNPYTLHHIIPQREKNITTFENGALLCRLEHDKFNVIEREKIKIAKEINEYFIYFKESKDLKALYEMKYYVDKLVKQMGYKVEERGKILTLRRW